MTYEQYWYGDVWMVKAYREADKERKRRKNAEAHLQGMYFYDALQCVLSAAFAEKGSRNIPKYPERPYPLDGEDRQIPEKTEQDEEQEALLARLYMHQMTQAGKHWGKNNV